MDGFGLSPSESHGFAMASVRLGVGDVGAAGSAICTFAAQQRGEAKSSLPGAASVSEVTGGAQRLDGL